MTLSVDCQHRLSWSKTLSPTWLYQSYSVIGSVISVCPSVKRPLIEFPQFRYKLDELHWNRFYHFVDIDLPFPAWRLSHLVYYWKLTWVCYDFVCVGNGCSAERRHSESSHLKKKKKKKHQQRILKKEQRTSQNKLYTSKQRLPETHTHTHTHKYTHTLTGKRRRHGSSMLCQSGVYK